MTMTEQRPAITRTTKRYPLQPLATALGIQLGRIGGAYGNRASNQHAHIDPDLEVHGLAALAAQLQISHRQAQRLHAHGLSDHQADRYACRSGHHPSVIWNDWWDIDPDEDEGDDGIMTHRIPDEP